MKKYLKYISLFTILFVGTLLLIDGGLSYVDRNNCNFKFSENIKYLIIGHSHPECAFNEEFVPDLKNMSHSGESYFYTYFKIKQVLDQNPDVEVVFIEYTNNQIEIERDEWIWGNRFINKRYPIYSSFMGFSDKFLLFKNNQGDFINAYSLSIKKRYARMVDGDFDYLNLSGGYRYLDVNEIDSLIKNTDSIETSVSEQNGDISLDNLLYLDLIIEDCVKKNKEVFLIRSPQHEKYNGTYNEAEYQSILRERYVNIPFLDFSTFPLLNADYADLEHLNFKGARKFSLWFADLIDSGLLNAPNKQELIEAEMRMFSNENF